MKREIKFRAQDIQSNEWHYGFYVHDSEWAKHFIFKQQLHGAFYQVTEFEVKENTVGQFTGLKDKKGVEIYEGDILEAYSMGLGHMGRRVVFIEGAFRLSCTGMLDSLISDYKADYLNVITNVHDEPLFLK